MADQQTNPSTSTSGPTAVFHRNPITYSNRGILAFKNQHNMIANLNTEAAQIGLCKEMMVFLSRSRISKAISSDVCVYKRHVEEFWDTATVDSVRRPTHIYARVLDKKITVTEGLIRRVLEFRDEATDDVVLNKEKVRGCLARCGYPELSGTVVKKFFSPPFKYLAHILIHCLSSKKSGYDTMSELLQNAFAALVMNMPFNFSKLVWSYMTEAASNKRADFDFLLYPRFVQLLINEVRPSLNKDGELLPMFKMDDTSVRYMFNYAERQAKPKDVPLWGHVVKVDYLCPPGSKWKNEGSDYEDEVEVVEIPAPKTTKRKKDQMVEERLEAMGDVRPSRKRAALGWRPRAGAAKNPSSSNATATETPLQPSASTQPETETATQSTSEAPSLQASLVSLMAKMERMEARDREREKQVELLRKEKEEMKKQVEDVNLLLLGEKTKNEEIEKRLKDLEECYDDNTNRMVIDKRGYYRLVDFVPEADLLVLPGADDAGTSGTNPE